MVSWFPERSSNFIQCCQELIQQSLYSTTFCIFCFVVVAQKLVMTFQTSDYDLLPDALGIRLLFNYKL